MSLDHKRGVWLRILPVVLGTGLFYVVLRGLPLNLLRAAIIRMRVGSFLAAVILYGLIFIPAAWRWHLILKLAQKAAGFIHTLRTSLIGHFFYTICFGVVGGDSAKAVVYAQRFGFSRAAILATAPLDRLLGFAGSLIFAALALLIGFLAGGFDNWASLAVQWPARTVLVICALTIAIAILTRRAMVLPAVAEFWALLKTNFRRVSKCRRTLLTGFACGFLVQVGLTAALACNLAAVSSAPIAWDRILWTFPFIIAVSALPISIGGLGTREGAAIVLWGAYGVPRADAIAASLLTLTVALFWAGIGGLLLFADENKRRASYWRAVSKRDAGFPQKIQASQSGKFMPLSSR